MSSSYASSEVSDGFYTNLDISLPSEIGGCRSIADGAQLGIQNRKQSYYPFKQHTYNPRFDRPYSQWLRIRCKEHAAIRIYEIEEYLLHRQTAHYSYREFKKTVFGAVAALIPGLYRFATGGLALRNAGRIRRMFVNAAIELISVRKVVTFGRADAKIMFSRPIAYYGDIDRGDLKKRQRLVKPQRSAKRLREDEENAQCISSNVKRARNGNATKSWIDPTRSTNVSRPRKEGMTEAEPIVVDDIEEGEMHDVREIAVVPVRIPETYKREREELPAFNPRAGKRARLC